MINSKCEVLTKGESTCFVALYSRIYCITTIFSSLSSSLSLPLSLFFSLYNRQLLFVVFLLFLGRETFSFGHIYS